jgi:hypothetical protein
MTNRRGARPSQVRPRAPSTGRPAPGKIRYRAPSETRLATHRRVEPQHGVPVVPRVVLIVAIVALGGGSLLLATGGLARAMSALGSGVGGFVSHLTATPVATVAAGVVPDPPSIEAPQEPYTNQPSVDLVVIVPSTLVGKKDIRIHVYSAVADKGPVQVADVAIAASPRVVVPSVPLVTGANNVTATIASPAGESAASPVVTFVLDQSKPKVTLTGPKNNSVVNRESVTITGKTQGRSAMVARNDANAASVIAVAATDGSFAITVPLAQGSNPITIEATDPAGNVGALALTYRRGTGALTATLTASRYRFSQAALPDTVDLFVVVANPDGGPLAGARVTFSITISGVAPITADRVTGADGHVTFRTTVPNGAAVGTGIASILVKTSAFGTATDRTVITITK